MPECRVELTDSEYYLLLKLLCGNRSDKVFLCELGTGPSYPAGSTLRLLAELFRENNGRVSIDWLDRCIIVREKDNAES